MLGWAIFLLVLAAVLLVLEAFLPSMGLLAVAAAAAGVVGITLLYVYNTTAGLAVTIVLAVLTPLGVAALLKIWPSTPIGRMLTLRTEQSSGAPTPSMPHDEAAPTQLVGEIGQAVSPLRPVGTCRFGDRRVECISITGMIEPGTRVQVTAVDGMEVRVKALPRSAAV